MKKFFANLVTTTIVTLILLFLSQIGVIPWNKIIPAYKIPDLKGLNKESAEIVCRVKNLTLDVADEVFSTDFDKGKIMSQIPEALKKSNIPEVEVVISKGKPLVFVPDLKGVSLEEAIQMLKTVSLTIGATKFDFSNEEDKGKIIATDPGAGVEVDYEYSVDIVISKGQSLAKIPSVIGKRLNAAKKILKNKGFKIGYIKKTTDIERMFGIVLRQHPAPGKEVQRGSSITIVLNEEEE